MIELIKDKHVLFITTKNLSYIRNTQEIDIIQQNSKCAHIIGSNSNTYLIRLLCVFFRLLFTNCKKYDVVFIGFAPQLILPFFSIKFRHNTVIIDFFISIYDTFVNDRQKFHPRTFFSFILHRWDEFTLRKANFVICDTKADMQYFQKEFHANNIPMEVLYLKADNSIFYPISVPPSAQTDKLFKVLYFGSILPLQGIDIILSAFEQLKDIKNISLCIIGPLPKEKLLTQDNFRYISWLSQKELALEIASADVCLAGHFHPSIEKARRTIPGKAYIYEAMNKKMILSDNAANHELFSPDENHFFVPMGDSFALANLILYIKTIS